LFPNRDPRYLDEKTRRRTDPPETSPFPNFNLRYLDTRKQKPTRSRAGNAHVSEFTPLVPRRENTKAYRRSNNTPVFKSRTARENKDPLPKTDETAHVSESPHPVPRRERTKTYGHRHFVTWSRPKGEDRRSEPTHVAIARMEDREDPLASRGASSRSDESPLRPGGASSRSDGEGR